MKATLGGLAVILGMVSAAAGQVTNAAVAGTNLIRLEWVAMPGNPYRVYATPDLVQAAWSNRTPAGLVFPDAQGSYVLTAGDPQGFYCATASDYLVVDLSAGPTANHYPLSYTNAEPAGGWGDRYKTTNLVLRRIPGGAFTMGSPTNELGREEDEFPHPVRLTKDFYIGVFEVTQKQWERVMGTWPSWFTNATYRNPRPVEQVSFQGIRGAVAGTNWPANGNVDTNSFMGRLRTKTGRAFDLPTEAQWEYACRAGTSTALNTGYDLTSTSNDVRMAEAGRYWYNGGAEYRANGDTSVGSAKVGSYLPNAWGLYDLHGNVWEWCLDWYGAYSGGAAIDPAGAVTGSVRMLRGGAWSGPAWYCRSGGRNGYSPADGNPDLGFRAALLLGQ